MSIMKDIMRLYQDGNKTATKKLILGQLRTNLSANKRNELLRIYNSL